MREYKVAVVLLHIFVLCLKDCTAYNLVLSGTARKLNVIDCESGASKDAKLTETIFFIGCSIHDCVGIIHCPPPDTTYLKFLNAKGADVTTMEHLFMDEVQPNPALTAEHFKGLPLIQLRVFYNENSRSYPSPESDFLEPLRKLRYITFKYGKFPPLPSHSVVEEASFTKGVSSGAFGGCKELRSLDLKLWEVYENYWLAGCPKLTTLRLKQMAGVEVERTIRGASHLKHLSVNYCQFKDQALLSAFPLPDGFFDDLDNLVTLDLDDNGIATLPYINITMPYLEELSLKNNQLGSIGLANRGGSEAVIKILNASPKLRVLDVSNNAEYNMCHAYLGTGSAANHKWETLKLEHPKLQSLILDKTNSAIDCITKEGLPALEYLDMVGNKLTHVYFEHLQMSKVPLRLSFYDSPLSTVYLFKSLYEDIYNRSKTTNKLNLKIVGLTSLDCDCKNGYFIKALREGLVNGELITCKGDEKKYMELRQKKRLSIKATQEAVLNQIDTSKLECDKFPCSSCVCRRDWEYRYLVANCKNTGIRQVPRFKHEVMRRLDAAHNHIEKLAAKDIPRTLVFADLSSNHIAHIDEETTQEMFISRERSLRLSGNPIACNCENYFLLKTLQERSGQIEDYANMTCRNEHIELLLSDVDVNKLCPKITVLTASLAVSGVFLVCAVAATVTHYRYGRAVRIFVHARGWFAWCVKEDSIDADREFDAFVSFCHTDTELVTEQLVPKLEEFGYRICVHYRDWAPGELIPTHIVRSVEASRRTIVLLSRSFLASMWGLLEFRIAHARALHDGVQRLIVVLLDDVQEADLDPDLRSYLRSNTYVRWDDPWFWDKIRYALPRPRSANTTTTHGGIGRSDHILSDSSLINVNNGYIEESPAIAFRT